MVRTREFDPAAALGIAVDVFSAKGYAETSMEDIVQATGVSRYGLYGTFGNKRELFEQALERFADNMGRQQFMQLLDPDASLEHIRRIFYDRVGAMCSEEIPRGCLLVHTAMELAPQDQELMGVLQKFMKRMSKTFAIGLATAKASGDVRDDLDERGTADQLTSLMFGLAVLGRVGYPREALERIVDTTLGAMRAGR